jgi:hypothetical protein
MFFLQRARDSQLWRAFGDISTLVWLVSSGLGVVAAIGAWLHHQPLYISILCFLAASALTLATSHYALKVWDRMRKENEKASEIPSIPAPNLVFQPLQLGGRSLANGVWYAEGGPNAQRHIAWVAPIKNEYLPDRKVGKAQGIKAEIILSVGGHVLRQWSPAMWVGEQSTTIEIPVAETKGLVLVVRRGTELGFWEMNSEGIPMGNCVGELKIRLLMEDGNGTTSHIATKRYRWKRAPELLDFSIEPL